MNTGAAAPIPVPERAGGTIVGVQICLLGPLEVRVDPTTPIEVGGSRLRRLLILLALEPGRVVSAGQLIDALWEGEPPSGASNALQALVSRLRRAVPSLPVDARPGGYRLTLEPGAVDLHRFEAAVLAGRALLPTDPTGARQRLTEALDLWRGPALADAAGAAFARAPVARLEELRLTATEDLIEARSAMEAPDHLVPWLRELVAAHPLRERLTEQLIRTLHRAGRPAEALAAYDRLRGDLADTLGADPGPALAALHLAVLRNQPPGPPPSGDATIAEASRPDAAPMPRHRGDLPTPLTSFVGREAAVARVGDLLERARLVTLTGPGGAGKTRLAVESARAVADRFPDGVWLVELAPVADPAEVPQALLGLLGLREQAFFTGSRSRIPPSEATEPIVRAIDALTGRRAMLVLDNCEHQLDAAADLADRLLAACPDLRVLVTSREPLGITGEALHPVESLEQPPVGADPATALAYPSVRLFVDRAAAVRPDFRVDDRTVEPVVNICRSLDGMPLAIELAAARLRAMTAEQVSTRLEDRFRLLTGGSRTALPRHQTLRAVVDWSWDLLDPADQALWRRLAVFSGGATAAAVERVCAGGELASTEVLDRLFALVEKSLVIATDDADPRYRMLETIREYGLARLTEAGEEQRVRRAHADEFLSLAERADPELRGRDQLHWVERLRAEHDNLHGALRWAIDAPEVSRAVRLTAALGWYWWSRGHRIEGADLALEVFTLVERTSPPLDDGATPLATALATAYLLGAMNLVSAHADVASAQDWVDRAVRFADAFPDAAAKVALLRLSRPMSLIIVPATQLAGSSAFAGLFTDDDAWVAGVARIMHGHTQLNGGAPAEEAAEDFRIALELFRSVGDRWGLSTTRFALADLAARTGDRDDAIGQLRAALRAVEEFGAAEDVPHMRARLAHLHWQVGEHETARQLLAEAHEEAERLGADARAAVSATWSELLRDSGDWARAARWTERAAELVDRRGIAPQWSAMLATSLAHVRAAQGKLSAARTHLDRALELAIDAGDAPVVAIVVVGYADLALRAGRPRAAATLLGGADGVRGGHDQGSLDAIRVRLAVRTTLGESGFTEAYAGGLGTRVDQVAELLRVTLDA
ncbi:putative ATPase/DNA-binding SARP family transcriptional activator [Micromonospora luteifusca]|uniref:ATPase/DNA-binding SARP family transcriptional activator n=1 Tax=Micromonospora luteifusca TaxID=709860 RepID=A0ABS2LXC8_9ACTN|nr:BTAD domain-containing putative transcriptional regulator [Micromonospora luteifusca]MBM7492851.1 putative ATPase/DNA-binding SARP family transcriptional activator [Micromonospora luteifusca]